MPEGKRNRILNQFNCALNPEALTDLEATNAKLAAFTYEVLQIRKKAVISDINTLYDCLDEYVALCSQLNLKLSNLMCYQACGVSKQLIDYWYTGQQRAKQPEYKEFATLVKALCGAAREQYAEEGKLNPVFAIWQQKVHDGFRDDAILTIAEERERTKTAAEIAKEYADIDFTAVTQKEKKTK